MREYHLPLYFRPYIDMPIVTEYQITKNGEDYIAKGIVQKVRVFVEDIPSITNIDPLLERTMIEVEDEKAKEMKKKADEMETKNGGKKKYKSEEEMIQLMEQDLDQWS